MAISIASEERTILEGSLPSGNGGELRNPNKDRAILYRDLAASVEKRDATAIQEVVKKFKIAYPNPDAEAQDPETALRALTQRKNPGFTAIPMPFEIEELKDKQLLLGSRPLIKPISESEKTALKGLKVAGESEGSLLATLGEIDGILKAKGYQGSPFFVTLWEIIRKGLEQKIKNTHGPLDSLTITIQSMQELSELFDEEGRPKQIAGLNFITNQKEIDDFVVQITSDLCRLKILNKPAEEKPLKVTLQRISLYDHNIVDPITGEVVDFEQYKAQVGTLVAVHKNSDLLYMHCYSGKERSVNAMAHLLMEEASRKWTELCAQQVEPTKLNAYFLSPIEMAGHINKQRKIAKTLEKMSVAQQQITFAQFFALMNKSRFPDESKKNEAAKDALAKAFVEKGAEVIARNLSLCLRGVTERKAKQADAAKREEEDRNEVMFRVLRISKEYNCRLMLNDADEPREGEIGFYVRGDSVFYKIARGEELSIDEKNGVFKVIMDAKSAHRDFTEKEKETLSKSPLLSRHAYSRVNILDLEKHYAESAPKLPKPIPKLAITPLRAIASLIKVFSSRYGEIASGWLEKKITQGSTEAERNKNADIAFKQSFVPDMFLRFLQNDEGLGALLQKKPAEIAKYLGCFLMSQKAKEFLDPNNLTQNKEMRGKMDRFIGGLVKFYKGTQVHEYLSSDERMMFSNILRVSGANFEEKKAITQASEEALRFAAEPDKKISPHPGEKEASEREAAPAAPKPGSTNGFFSQA